MAGNVYKAILEKPWVIQHVILLGLEKGRLASRPKSPTREPRRFFFIHCSMRSSVIGKSPHPSL
jgi:hypothetical protein